MKKIRIIFVIILFLLVIYSLWAWFQVGSRPDKIGLHRCNSLEKLEESIRFLITGSLDYEFRTTVVQELHSRQDFEQMGHWFGKICSDRKPKKIFLQPYTDRDSVLTGGLHGPEKTQLLDFLDAISPFVHSAEIRGIEY